MIAQYLETLAFKHVAPRGIRHITPVSPGGATGLVAEVYRQMEREFQLAPPVTIHSVIPELLAGIWTASRESLICGPADRVAREVVAATVSQLNVCPYCVDVHSMMLEGAGRHDLAESVSSGPNAGNHDPAVARLVEWAAATCLPGAEILSAPPIAQTDRPQLFGTAVMFHYINRMVNVFLEASPMPFRIPEALKRSFGATMTKRIVSVVGTPGESLHFLPASPLPAEFHWAKSNPAVDGGLSRMSAAVEHAGNTALPANARELLLERMARWHGEHAGLSRAWVEEAIQALHPTERAIARLALLTAFASHQIDDGIIRACRSDGANDEVLVAAAAWAAFRAARRIGSWLSPPSESVTPPVFS
ncbi:MAG: carboxymuconolactone decarboxylase family protein [Sterolibacterium sp.]|jgi:AhpD family alkylhydroperoxidase